MPLYALHALKDSIKSIVVGCCGSTFTPAAGFTSPWVPAKQPAGIGSNGCFVPSGRHGDTQIGLGQGRCIIDAVADHCHRPAALDPAGYVGGLVRGQDSAAGAVEAQLPARLPDDRVAAAAQKMQRAAAVLPQLRCDLKGRLCQENRSVWVVYRLSALVRKFGDVYLSGFMLPLQIGQMRSLRFYQVFREDPFW